MLTNLLERNWLTLHSAVVFAGLAIYVAVSHTLRQRRQPSAAIAWVISLALLPYLALPLYLMFGSRKLGRGTEPLATTSARRQLGSDDGLAAITRQLAAAMGLSPATSYGALHVHADGAQALLALHQTIDAATERLDLCTFILGRDPLGDELTARLASRARAGVAVRLLIDGVGIYFGGHPDLSRLKKAGVEVTLFVSPIHSPLRGRTNLRNHRKMVIADGRSLWCGGRNLVAECFVGDPASPSKLPWIDLSFDLTGDIARDAQLRFDEDWNFAKGSAPQSPASMVAPMASGASPLAQIIPSGPDQIDDTMYSLLVSACFTSRERILAVTPYFVPDSGLLMALALAARRGVRVDLVLPAKSNHRLADVARHRALRDLVAAGVHVWLLPRMIHAKAVVIDRELALAGTANLDLRSLFLNYEIMLAFYEPADIEQFAKWIAHQRANAAEYVAKPPGLLREVGEGLVLWIAFQL